ncbi:histidine phosphatase family protein [Pseudoroseomonas globiformis]|uniref:Histidine phosphatase family protein n=1 Tax=Teichococcus globiformis TaxID=2307229 RepID=A0ABV7FT69_9PROT
MTEPFLLPRLALIRHMPAAVAPGVCYGRLDLAVRDDVDPALVLEALQGFPAKRLLCSPARRCRELAELVTAATDLVSEADKRLLELDFGAWEGMPWDAVPRAALDDWAADPWGFAPPGGESGAELVARVRAFHAEMNESAIIVAHGGPLKVLRCLLEGRAVDLLAPAQPPGSVWFSPPK